MCPSRTHSSGTSLTDTSLKKAFPDASRGFVLRNPLVIVNNSTLHPYSNPLIQLVDHPAERDSEHLHLLT